MVTEHKRLRHPSFPFSRSVGESLAGPDREGRGIAPTNITTRRRAGGKTEAGAGTTLFRRSVGRSVGRSVARSRSVGGKGGESQHHHRRVGRRRKPTDRPRPLHTQLLALTALLAEHTRCSSQKAIHHSKVRIWMTDSGGSVGGREQEDEEGSHRS